MRRATGPGLIEIDQRYAGGGMLKALIYNFDFDDVNATDLKKEHADFLKTCAAPLLTGNRGSIWLEGTASRVGTNDHNLRLSQQRVQRVVDFLAGAGVAKNQMQPDAVGEEHANTRVLDDQRDRAVSFVILSRAHRDPPPPRQTPPPPAITTLFRLRQLGDITLTGAPRLSPVGGRLGGGLAVEGIFFEIQDVEHRLSAF